MFDPNTDTKENSTRRGEIFKRMAEHVPGPASVKPGRALALTADNRVVNDNDADAVFVLVGATGSLPPDLASELGVKANALAPVVSVTPTVPTTNDPATVKK